MKIVVRITEISDAESISELSHQLGYKTQNASVKNRLNEVLKNTDHCVYVALENDKVIAWIHGFYALRVASEFFIEIGGLLVNEKYRNNGIGKELVHKLIDWSKFKDCEKIRVRCNVIRKESHQFYEKIGFEINKEQKIFNKSLV